MDIRRLQHLVTLADKANYARAAEQLHLSQPALTRSVQAAEQEFGVRLFDRGAGEVRPTAAGLFVLERARQLVQQSRNLQRDMQLYRERLMGDTACGFGPFPTQFLLAPLLQRARNQYPQVHVRAIMGNWQQLLQRLKDEEIEFFVAETRELPVSGDWVIRPLPPQRGGLYVRSGHPLLQQAGTRFTLPQLHAYGLAAVRLPQTVREALCAQLQLGHERELLAVECDDVHSLIALTLQTDTVLAAIEPSVRHLLQGSQLQQVHARDVPSMTSHYGVVWQRGRSLSPMAEWLVQQVSELAVPA
ncbi:LysR family transcriptional regulator [Comamonas testosteroni]|uniref:LysR family transcriptional regulator n=1 Tax=Comamonas testosteroni TaxID=285 RepID=A0A373FHU9_COMTE|nr:LysR family transcriptional regulator [Comamonas testosteroni]